MATTGDRCLGTGVCEGSRLRIVVDRWKEGGLIED